MESLAAWSKFTGSYDRWKQIRESFSLRWTSGNESLQSLERFFNPDLNLSHMIDRVKEMIRVLPEAAAVVVKYATLTGLRPTEACESVRLLNPDQNSDQGYYNPETQTLEHFRFPAIFLRRTKKAYVSYITKEQLFGIGVLGCKTPPLIQP